jgi:hypothetical protein
VVVVVRVVVMMGRVLMLVVVVAVPLPQQLPDPGGDEIIENGKEDEDVK